jgi:drug/metabolite transporter (DMT)-like permease
MEKNTRNAMAKAALFCAAIIWGSSFLVVKDSMDVMQPFFLMAARFTIASVLLSLVFHKKLKKLNREYFLGGFIIGIFLFLGYTFQTIGIIGTTPGKNAFLTSVYCVLVPFMFWAVDKKKPDAFHIIAAITTVIGIGLVSLSSSFTIGIGDSLSLIGGVAYAAHIVSITKYSKGRDPVLLTILQFGYGAVFSWIAVFIRGDMPVVWTYQSTFGILYLSVLASAVAMLLQNVGQKYTHPAPASIILSLEAVFGVVFSVIFYHEVLTLRLILGFFLIFAAVIISETKLAFLIKDRKEAIGTTTN